MSDRLVSGPQRSSPKETRSCGEGVKCTAIAQKRRGPDAQEIQEQLKMCGVRCSEAMFKLGLPVTDANNGSVGHKHCL